MPDSKGLEGMTRSAISGPFWASAFLFLPVALAACGPATYGTGQMPEMALFREVTGGLLDKNTKKEPIEYQPRAPLVLPPAAGQLPPPMESGSTASPDWPVDRDQLVAEADARAEDDDPRNDINQAEYRRLKPLQGVFPRQTPTMVSEDSGKEDYYQNIVHGRSQRQAFQQAVADSKGYGRTERRFLTDPPTAYRQPDPTVPMETAAAPQKKKGNFLTRWWRR